MTVRILMGDVFEQLAALPADHFACVLTSPPYWGLRSYLDAAHPDKPKEIGCEPTLGEHLDVMVRFCREVRRVLRPDGVFWLNYGDCYATSPNGRSAADTKAAGTDDRTFRDKPFSTVGPVYPPDPGNPFPDVGRRGGGNAPSGAIYEIQPTSRQNARRGRSGNLGNGGINGVAIPEGRIVAGGYLKPKDLCLIPQRLAIALQEDGWWVRSLLPWVKRNGMPESIRDRPASSVEYVIMLTKSERYAYDAEAVRRPASLSTNARVSQNVAAQAGSDRANGGAKTNGPMKAVIRRPKRIAEGQGVRSNESFENATCAEVLPDRNFRNTDLFFDSLEPPFGLISGSDGLPIAIDVCPQGFKEAHFATFPEALATPLLLAGNPAKGPVLDPFGGAGTVGLVAERLGMDSTLIELNPESVAIADRRIRSGLGRVAGIAPPKANDLPLFSGDAA
jgi:DNA modification methylase